VSDQQEIQHSTREQSTVVSYVPIRTTAKHSTYRKGLSLHETDAIDTLELFKERGLGSKFLFFPGPKLFSREGSNDLKVEAAAADDTFDRLDAIYLFDIRQDGFEGLLGLHQRRLVVVAGPFASPLPRNSIELDTFCNGDSDLGRTTAKKGLVGAKGLKEKKRRKKIQSVSEWAIVGVPNN
jgi:hypothetical protein